MGKFRIAVAMMQKNEGALLRAWIDHYLRLTDAGLVTILDNGSYDAATLAALGYAREQGVQVVTEHADPRAFARKGMLVRDVLAARAGDAEFLLPCDCDEFLIRGAAPGDLRGAAPGDVRGATPGDATDSGLEDGVQAGLARLAATGATAFRIGQYFYNFPDRPAYYAGTVRKSLFAGAMPEQLDTGFHVPELEGIRPCRFAYVHFHNKSLPRLLRAAREKLKFRTPDFAPATLRSRNLTGRHMLAYFELDEAGYASRFADRVAVPLPVPGLAERLEPARLACIAPETSVGGRVLDAASLRCPFNPAAHDKRIRMSRAEAEFYFHAVLGARQVFEYGLGGSTLFACQAGVREVGTVETDPGFAASCIETNGLAPFIERGVLQLFLRDIGPTKAWGYPVTKPDPATVSALVEVPAAFRAADVFLVDGRYRLACAASVYLAQENPAARLLVHDFPNRPAYQRMLELYEMETLVETLACLRPRPGLRQRAERLLAIGLGNAK